MHTADVRGVWNRVSPVTREFRVALAPDAGPARRPGAADASEAARRLSALLGDERRRRSGLSLVEVLVVVVIMAILLAILMPAVQSARESARRAGCAANLALIGKGILAFEQAHDRFPPGTGDDYMPLGTRPRPATPPQSNGAYNSSFYMYILPFMGLDLYPNWAFTGGSGGENHPVNAFIDMVPIPELRCPSSPTFLSHGYQPHRFAYPWATLVTGAYRWSTSYKGIAGSSRDFPGFTEYRRQTARNVGCCEGGWAAAGGILAPLGQVKIPHVKDGLSNTLLVSETSDFYYNRNTGRYRYSQAGWELDYNADSYHLGSLANYPPNLLAPAGQDFTNRYWNIVGILNPLNSPVDGDANGSWGNCQTGACMFTSGAHPLCSPHIPGGVNALMGDGAVRYLGNATSLDTLSALAVRDDGLELPPLQ